MERELAKRHLVFLLPLLPLLAVPLLATPNQTAEGTDVVLTDQTLPGRENVGKWSQRGPM